MPLQLEIFCNMCKSNPTIITKTKADQLSNAAGIHVAEWHSNLHTSGACVISFCVAIVAIVFLLYCFRHKLCPRGESNNHHESRFEHFRKSLRGMGRRQKSPSNEIDANWQPRTPV